MPNVLILCLICAFNDRVGWEVVYICSVRYLHKLYQFSDVSSTITSIVSL